MAYRVWCETEGQYVRSAGALPDPVVCPTDSGHTIRAGAEYTVRDPGARLVSPDGSVHRIKVSDAGALSTEAL